MASRKRARTEDIPSSSALAPPLQELAHNRPIISMEHFLEQVNPEPADPQSPVVNPPSSPELEAVPPSPPLIVICDASSDEAAAPPDSLAAETTNPPISPIGGIADHSDSSSGEAVALTNSLV
ncbi:hypothetical protein JHK86_006532 [Glycine max]|nr:hypothetical protein JHK86_006532 [Glycine max]